MLFQTCFVLLFVTLFGAAGQNSPEKVRLDEDSVKSVIQKLNAGFIHQNKELLQSLFSNRFSISVSMWPSADKYLSPVLERNAVESIAFVSLEEPAGDTTCIKTLIKGQLGEKESVIALDENYKLLFIDYLDQLYGVSRYNVSEQKAVIPFQSDSGKIIVPLRLNNHEATLRFLFDTGADGMAIRKFLADSLHLSEGYEQQASFVGGNAQISISTGNTVHLSDSVVLSNQNIALFDRIEEGIDGIIGLNFAEKYRIQVDFDKQQIILSTYGKTAETIPGIVIPITNHYKIITLPVHLNLTGDKAISGNFILDTGANYHVIAFSRFVRKNRLLLSGFQPEGQSATVSMGHTTTVFSGKANRFELTPDIVFTDIPITLQASSSRNDAESVPDGSIGIHLINRYNFTLDLLEKKIYLIP
jgi:hypothetical protein